MVLCPYFWQRSGCSYYTCYFNDYFMADTSDSGSGNASFAVAAVIIPIWMKKKADEQGREVREALADANAVTLEGVQGLKEILTLNYRTGYEEKNRAYLERMYKKQFSYSKRLGTEGMLLQMVLGVSGLVAALIAAWYVGKDGMAASMYTIIVVLSAMILGPVIEICNTARNFGLILQQQTGFIGCWKQNRWYRILEMTSIQRI